MAFGRKCYCCGETYPTGKLFYCKDCLLKLKKAFELGKGVILQPQHYDHCISCGEYKNRKIVYTGKTDLFSTHPEDMHPICDICVQEEFKIYNQDVAKENGRVYFENSAMLAFKYVEKAFAGEAEKAGFETEEEMQNYMNGIRKETKYGKAKWRTTDFKS